MPHKEWVLLRTCFSSAPSSMAKGLACAVAVGGVRAQGDMVIGDGWRVWFCRPKGSLHRKGSIYKKGWFRGACAVPVYVSEGCPEEVRAMLMEKTLSLFGRPPPIILW